MARVARQIKQLGITFNKDIIANLKNIVSTEVVDGVEIDENELASMEDMMKEASAEPQHHGSGNVAQPVPVLAPRISDASPITRSSLAVLAGDENDLLAESPVFDQANDSGGF